MKRSATTLPKILFATTALASAILLGNYAQANPLGEQVVEGSATVKRPSDIKTEVHQSSDRAIIEWQSFDISEGEWTQFIQPNSSAVTLNRITGGNPNQILGQLTANGTVMLVNPDGILFGKNSKVDVGSLIATPHDIANQDFMAGRYEFTKSGNPSASIINEGTITAEESGIVAFVAPGVRNSGIITARMGQVGLSSGNSFTLDLYGDELINLRVDDEIIDQVIDLATGQPMSALVDNQGRINADGGKVALTAATARLVVDNVINNDGVIEARSVGMQNGQIILGAQTVETKVPQSSEQKVRVSGKLDASGLDLGQTGGEIHILGEILGLTNATVTTDGDAGGGIILVGGDYMGGAPNPNIVSRYGIALEDQNIPTATNLTVDEGTILSASALTTGNGGKIVNWSDNTTTFDGTILAKGGSESGDGGFVEVSGWTQLFYEKIEADLTASNGSNGTILFDPEVNSIDETRAFIITSLLNKGNNVIEQGDKIELTADIIKSSGGEASLNFYAMSGIHIASGVTIGSSSGALYIVFVPDWNDGFGTFSTATRNENITKGSNELSFSYHATEGENFGNILLNPINTYFANDVDEDTDSYSMSYEDLLITLVDDGYISIEQAEELYTSVLTVGSGVKMYTNGGDAFLQDVRDYQYSNNALYYEDEDSGDNIRVSLYSGNLVLTTNLISDLDLGVSVSNGPDLSRTISEISLSKELHQSDGSVFSKCAGTSCIDLGKYATSAEAKVGWGSVNASANVSAKFLKACKERLCAELVSGSANASAKLSKQGFEGKIAGELILMQAEKDFGAVKIRNFGPYTVYAQISTSVGVGISGEIKTVFNKNQSSLGVKINRRPIRFGLSPRVFLVREN